MRSCIMGVDPGLGGAIAFYEPERDKVHVFDMPVVNSNVDVATVAGAIRNWKPEIAIVELVGARPGQGVSSMFKFGCGYGMVQGVIATLGVPLHLVAPSKWKKHFALGPDKEASRALALRLWPLLSEALKRKKDEARAEAALIARYAHIHDL